MADKKTIIEKFKKPGAKFDNQKLIEQFKKPGAKFDNQKLIEKFKKQGVKFSKAGKPTNMEKIYKTNPELHGQLIDNFYSTKGTMDDFNLRKFLGNAFKKEKK